MKKKGISAQREIFIPIIVSYSVESLFFNPSIGYNKYSILL